MKITILLKRDHAALRDLFNDFDNADADDRRAIFRRIRGAFDLHTQLEEEVLYAPLQELDATRPLVREAIQEHRLARQACAELAALTAFDASALARVQVLRENLEHHFEEEEDELFPKARDLLGEERLADIGHQFEKRRDQLIRAHTPAPA